MGLRRHRKLDRKHREPFQLDRVVCSLHTTTARCQKSDHKRVIRHSSMRNGKLKTLPDALWRLPNLIVMSVPMTSTLIDTPRRTQTLKIQPNRNVDDNQIESLTVPTLESTSLEILFALLLLRCFHHQKENQSSTLFTVPWSATRCVWWTRVWRS